MNELIQGLLYCEDACLSAPLQTGSTIHVVIHLVDPVSHLVDPLSHLVDPLSHLVDPK